MTAHPGGLMSRHSKKMTHVFDLGTTIAQRRDPEAGPNPTPTTHIGGLNSGVHYMSIFLSHRLSAL